MALDLQLSLCLPTDELSVPVVRHICGYALDEVGVTDACKSDITLALTEACTNVLDHAQTEGTAYEVEIGIDATRCVIRVKDTGQGFDIEASDTRERADETAESGRGLGLIKGLVDRVQFTLVEHDADNAGQDGLVVQLEKGLEFDEDHPVRRHATIP